MNYDAVSESFKISRESNIPPELHDLEEYLSNAIINNEKAG